MTRKIRPTPSAAKVAFSLCLLFSLALASSCRPGAVKLSELPPPPGSEKGVKYPEFNTEIDLATTFIVADLKEGTGEVDTLFYTLTEPTDWKKVVDFYDAALKAGGFTRVLGVPARADRGQSVRYERGGFGGGQKVVVSLVEVRTVPETKAPPGEEKYQFLMLATDAR